MEGVGAAPDLGRLGVSVGSSVRSGGDRVRAESDPGRGQKGKQIEGRTEEEPWLPALLKSGGGGTPESGPG